MRPSEGEFGDGAARWFADLAGPPALRRLIDGGVPAERAAWQSFRAFGLRDVVDDDADLPARAGALAQVALAAGRALYAGPLLEGEPPAALRDGDDASLRIVVVAFDDAARPAPFGDDRFEVSLRIPHAAAADRWLGCVPQPDGMVLVGGSQDTGEFPGARLADGSSHATVRRTLSPSSPRTQSPLAAAIREWRDLVWMTTAARLVGVAEASRTQALEYLQVRTQFGRTLASFQVLQHQAVDRHCDVLLARALLDRVLAHWSEPGLRASLVPALKAFAGKVALATTKTSVQHFGAMGFSHEGDAGLYLRHALTLAARHGDERAHRRAFAANGLDFLPRTPRV